MKTFISRLISVSIAFGIFLLASPVYAADIAVSGGCSLTDAIFAANNDEAVGLCPAGDGADVLALSANILIQFDLPKITSDMTIEGKGYTINGNNRFRVFYIEEDSTVAIHDLTLTRSMARYKGNRFITAEDDALGGAIYNKGRLTISDSSFSHNVTDEYGGAVYNTGDITISSSSFSDNSAFSLGGAIYNTGDITISDSSFSDNSAEDGGAILNNWGGGITISDSSFSRNAADVYGGAISSKTGTVTISSSSFNDNAGEQNGGAIYNWFGKTSISDSSFTGNAADGRGGAVYSIGNIAISDSSFINNAANAGGGLYTDGNSAVYLYHLTLARNTAERGGGIYKADRAEVNLHNSIVAHNSGGDCVGELAANISSLIQDGSCSPALSGDPMLGALVEPENGSTAHYPLMADSPAIGAADEEYCPDTDQVGTARPQGSACNIGAIEYTTTIKSEDAVIIVSTSNINVRRGPSTNYGVVDGFLRGKEAVAIGRNADGSWVQMNTGWVVTQLIEARGSIERLPVTSE